MKGTAPGLAFGYLMKPPQVPSLDKLRCPLSEFSKECNAGFGYAGINEVRMGSCYWFLKTTSAK
jgi:hypothetical protein